MRRNKGITLVALVITIIVLLILAGIILNLMIGQDGIITKAQEAGKIQKIAEIKEKIGLAILDAETEAKIRKEQLEQEQVKDIVSKYGELQEDGDTIKLKEVDAEVSLKDIYNGTTSNTGSYTANKEKIEQLEKQIAELEKALEDSSKTESEKSQELVALKEELAKTTVTEDRILKGYTAYKNNGIITGTMEDRGTLNWNPSSSTSYTIPAGFYSGGTISTSNAYTTGYNEGYTKGIADGKASANIVDVWRSNTNTNTFSFSYTAPDNGSLSYHLTFSGNSHRYIASTSGEAYFWVKKNSSVVLGSTSNVIKRWNTDTYECHIGYDTVSWNGKMSLSKGDVVQFYGYCKTKGKVDFANNYGEHNLLLAAGSVQFIY